MAPSKLAQHVRFVHIAVKHVLPPSVGVKPVIVRLPYRYDHKTRMPLRPHSVVWDVFGLLPAESLEIHLRKVLNIADPKISAGLLHTVFPAAKRVAHGFGWLLPAGGHTVESGPAFSRFGDLGTFGIKYDVRIYEAGHLKARLDPGFELVPDP